MCLPPAQVEFYISQSQAANHAVREAACACIAELGKKVNRGVIAGLGKPSSFCLPYHSPVTVLFALTAYIGVTRLFSSVHQAVDRGSAGMFPG